MSMDYVTKAILGVGAVAALMCGVLLVAVYQAPKFLTAQTRGVLGKFPQVQRETQGTIYTLYSSQKYGFTIAYPKTWPEPIDETPEYAGKVLWDNTLWSVALGPKYPTACEGEDCYQYFVKGIPMSSDVVDKLSNDSMVRIVSDSKQGEYRIVEYTEGGICGDLNALIFGHRFLYRVTARCAGDTPERAALLREIVNSFEAMSV